MHLHELNLTLDWPVPSLWKNRNHGAHWAVDSGAAAEQKQAAFVLAREALGRAEPHPQENVALYFTFVKGRGDLDNLLGAMKHAQDGIAQALRVDDKRFRPVVLDWENGPTKCVRVMLRWWDE